MRMPITTILALSMLFASATTLVSSPAEKTVTKKVATSGGEEFFMIPGIGAGVESDGESLKVVFIMPKDDRPKEYRSVDIDEGDLLLMLNGKRLKSIDDLKNELDSVETGDPLEFGIRRGKDLLLTSFAKPDPSKENGQRMMVMTMTVGDEEDGNVETKLQMFGSGEDNMPVMLLMEIGLILTEDDDGLKAMAIIGDGDFSGEMPGEGDRIVSLQSKEISTIEDCEKLYSSIKDGDDVEIVFDRDGKQHTLSFVRAHGKAAKNIIKKSANPE